jgi:hypothetical protein
MMIYDHHVIALRLRLRAGLRREERNASFLILYAALKGRSSTGALRWRCARISTPAWGAGRGRFGRNFSWPEGHSSFSLRSSAFATLTPD